VALSIKEAAETVQEPMLSEIIRRLGRKRVDWWGIKWGSAAMLLHKLYVTHQSAGANEEPPAQDLLNVLELRAEPTKVTAVHRDRLLPCQASRTSLRRSHRSRKQNQPGLRHLRSERYLCQ
jgi:hypothetical protein